ncbi:MAG: DUF3592 domain-containing protein [Opitutaceae bacterium]
MDPAPSLPDQIVALLTTPRPRQVPPELQRAATRHTAPFLFILIGSGLAAFAMLFVAAFFPWNLARQWKLDADGAATTAGKIVVIGRTGVSVEKSRVMRITFEYSPPPSGATVRGTCYRTRSPWSVGDSVKVRYRPDEPSLACVEGARLTKTGGMAAFVILFPGIGVTMIVIGLRLRHRAMHLLVHGEVAEAFVTALERTETIIGNDPVYRIVLQRRDRPDAPPLETNKWQPAVVGFARQRMESKQPVFVLFDPKRPKNLLLPEAL